MRSTARCCLLMCLTVAAFGLVMPCARAQDNPEQDNSEQSNAPRWTETAYGISVETPTGTTQIEQPTDGAVVAWKHGQDYLISFDITYTTTKVDLDEVAQSALVEVGFSRSGAHLRVPKQRRIAGRPGALLYYDIKADDKFWRDAQSKEPWLYGQAIVMLEPYAAAVLTLSSDLAHEDEACAAFERLIDSMRIPFADELDAVRTARIEAGRTLLQSLSPEDIRDALPADQWYRLIENGQDTGYAHHRTVSDPEKLRSYNLVQPGTLVLLDTRHVLNGHPIDTRAQWFATDDQAEEYWSIKTSLRVETASNDAGLQAAASKATTWVETGSRAPTQAHGREQNVITVITESPPASDTVRQVERHERFTGSPRRGQASGLSGSVDQSSWATPPVAFLSQIAVQALPELIPADAPVLSFYAYHSNTGSLGLRTVRVAPNDLGGVTVFDRPTVRRAETRHVFDADHRLVRRVLPSGLVIQPTTPEELKTLWDIDE